MKFSIVILVLIFAQFVNYGCAIQCVSKPNLYQIHIGSDGSGWIKVSEFLENSSRVSLKYEYNVANSVNVLCEYPLINQRTQTQKVLDGVWIISYGEFLDIFDLFKTLDSSYPFTLGKKNKFRIQWDGNSLYIDMQYAFEDNIISESQICANDAIQMVFTTDGSFKKNSSGIIDQGGKRITLNSETTMNFTNIRLVIKDLGEN